PWAKKVAEHLGTTHTERVMGPEQMLAVLKDWGDLFDEPFGDCSGTPTFLVSRMAREQVKVALSADGGDELFSGYSHYGVCLEREKSLAKIPVLVRQAIAKFPVGALRGIGGHAMRRNVTERIEKMHVLFPTLDRSTIYDLAMSFWTPWDVSALLGGEVAPRDCVRAPAFADQMARCDLRYYLPDDILVKVDRTTMAVGLEGREPLLDHRLAEFALRLPLSMRRGSLGTKHLLRKILYRHVPRELIDRPKQGFAIPLGSWMRGELAPMLDQYLEPKRIRDAGIFDPGMVASALSNFREGGTGNDRLDVQKVWLLAAFEMWRERWAGAQDHRNEGTEHARAVHY
ncbi:MAG: asparagine synthetase B family protein, partial [Usitatibacter sp.]